MKKITILLLCMFILAARVAEAAASETGYVRLAIKGTNVNLRPQPRAAGSVVAQMNTGDVFIAEKNPVINDGDGSQWYKIVLAADAGSNKISALSERDSRFNNDAAFVRADFTTISPLKEGDTERILTALGEAAASEEDFFTLCGSGTPQKVEAAIKAGADVNETSEIGWWTPLMLAAEHNENPDVLSVLIQAGADVNAMSYYGETPLMLAAEHNENPDVLSVLIQAGADVNAKNPKEDSTPLMDAARRNKNPEVLSVLIRAGAEVNEKDIVGSTPLMWAAGDNSAEILNVLIQAGADVNAKSDAGWTPLMEAAWQNSAEVLNALIKAGAEVNAKADNGWASGWTALSFAAEKNKPEVVSLLLASGATVSENDLELAQKNERLKDTSVIEELRKILKK